MASGFPFCPPPQELKWNSPHDKAIVYRDILNCHDMSPTNSERGALRHLQKIGCRTLMAHVVVKINKDLLSYSNPHKSP